ncbi:Hypothetical predicted protein [Mytilus galloprovincialis]|uniref:Fibrinogen-related protein n=1 Tax=Mytilus galloprovincialis TaxID=29158 RepID=A0A8B6G8K5_MYTGA|nr:Hypothetical predicted protein [Mytilus galloprovincialis]
MCADIFAMFLFFVMSNGEFMVIEKQKDVIYTGHVAFEIFTIPMWSLCAQLCTRLTICKSLNFISLNKTCQINIAEPNCPTSCLSSSVGDSFIAASALPKELAGICKGHACNITEICVPRSQSEGYLCHPLIGYRIVPPKVYIPMSFYEVIIGQSVTLVCIVKSHLAITNVTWTKYVSNSVSTIDSGGSPHLYNGGNVGTPSLTLLNVAQNDVGTYICSATNNIDTRSSNAITVSLHLPPNVQITLSSYEVTFGKSVTLVCLVTSRLPLTNLSWEKDIDGSVSIIDPDNSGNLYGGGKVESPSLIILNVTANDTGTYICSASNLVGTRSSDTISLVVNLPPKVHIPQSSYDGIFGQSVTLVCMVTSQLPLTGVTWTNQNGGSVSTIDPDNSANRYSDGNIDSPSLIILNVTQNDTGTYFCSASNKVDTRSSGAITLIVHSVPTVFVHQLSYDATFGSTVTLECTVTTTTSATITDVYWQKKNECQTKNISSSTTSVKYSGGTVNTPSLTIVNADGLDVSSYTCFASNIAGTGQSSSSFLNVSAADVPRDCSALHPLSASGVYRIYPTASVNFDVYCDMDTLCGGWTVFQKRFDGTFDFYRVWNDYKTGFGDLNAEFWLGNDYLNYITSSGQNRLYIDLEAYDGSTAYAEYAIFSVGNSQSDYIINVSGYSGNAGDSFQYHNGMKFSTSDRDNDNAGWNCAIVQHSSWWNNGCISSNLNGRYGIGNDTKGVLWRGFKNWWSLKTSKMMMKRHY